MFNLATGTAVSFYESLPPRAKCLKSESFYNIYIQPSISVFPDFD